MNKTERGSRRYFIEVMGAVLLYAVLLIGRNRTQDSVKIALTVASLVPIWLIGLAVVRFYRNADEYLRRKVLLSLAGGGGLTALLLMSYSQLESVGLPSMPPHGAWLVMGLACAVCSLALAWPDHISQVGMRRSLQWATLSLAIIAIPTTLYALVAPSMGWPHRPGVLILIATLIFVALNGWNIFVRRSCA